ncbi:response regulator [Hymenobacter gummosus]|uniref:Response regulator n=1 Tax=Hymenobacter gummosus TaxID=1776032 RepID=A0A431TZX6_9BACT|nr:response regulator [Hymenobacter gummosus]RTQ47531.1 response regulator [Hymenobacter gummosus]
MHQLASILLVDDDPSTNFLNEAALYPLRLTDTYLTAHDGEEALALLREQTQATPEQPVLVLLDMAMPVMGGMEFLEAFRGLPASIQAATVLVVLAINMSSVDMSRLGEYPIAGTMSKPLTGDRLSTILSLHFNGRAAGR